MVTKHGGARKGAGRPEVLIDERRMLVLHDQGYSYRQIAERFGVDFGVIQRRFVKLKKDITL